MRLIEPMPVTEAEFVTCNIPDDGYVTWDALTSYSAGQIVKVEGLSGRAYQTAFESVSGGNLGNNPATDDGTFWMDLGAPNRWKAFDGRISDPVEYADVITYRIDPTVTITGLAFFGLSAGSVRVRVHDPAGPTLIYDQTITLVDTTDVVDWFSFFLGGVEYDTAALFLGVPGYAGHEVRITIDATGVTARVGQIVLGKDQTLGVSMDGGATKIEDFSVKERDDFGNVSIVERAFADISEFYFMLPNGDERRIKRILSRVRAKPAVYHTGESAIQRGALVYGLFDDFSIPISGDSHSIATLEIEGLV